jgi:ATP-dependent Lhr-like helicase
MDGPIPSLAHVGQPVSAEAALAVLPEPVAHWFRRRYGAPTAIQRAAWPTLAAGKHLLISAPTGTGKTLAAFAPLLGPLFDAEPVAASPWALSCPLRCVYVAPLKALNNDVCRNLTRSIDELAATLPEGIPRPRLAVRTGDTPGDERRRLREQPPDVLLTTPESLAVLLSQAAWQPLFRSLRWLVVDEVHALAGSKRGADLAVSLERLTSLAAGPVQRIGLSATATPLATAAQFLAGRERPCAIAHVDAGTALELTLCPLEGGRGFLSHLVRRLEPELRAHQATLVFANTRALAERLSWALRRHLGGEDADWDRRIAVHHSALAPERRLDVEERFKRGELRAVVSSTSLELGIDMGPVELVVLIHAPGDVVRLLQRVGRAGHGPARVRRGLVLTLSGGELLEAAVTAASGQASQCEPLHVPAHPLDALCQQLLGMASADACRPDEVFELVRRAYPYRGLSRRDFDDCLAYLRGLDREGRPWLPARIQDVEDRFTVRDERTARLLRRNVGTILAEETLEVRLLGEKSNDTPRPTTVIGEVDQTFGERLQPGDRFLLDGRCLEFRRQEATALLVEEVVGRPAVPRWGSDGWPLSTELARRLYALRVQAAEALREGPTVLAGLLRRDYGLEDFIAETLVAYFQRQECISEIPDTLTCLVEVVPGAGGVEYYLHTPLNRLGNDALARVVVHRLARNRGRPAHSVVADLGLCLCVPGSLLAPPDVVGPSGTRPSTGSVPSGSVIGGPAGARPSTGLAPSGPGGVAEVLRGLLAAEEFAADLDAALAGSAALRLRFQRVGYTGLMLLRNPEGRRPRVGGGDWGERRLFDQVQAHDPDFVLLRQARREVLAELCDLDAASAFIAQLRSQPLRCRWLPRVSPFAESWTQADAGPAEAVETPGEALQRLHAALMGGAPNERAD